MTVIRMTLARVHISSNPLEQYLAAVNGLWVNTVLAVMVCCAMMWNSAG